MAGVSLALNLITRSRIERQLWAPVAAGLLASSLWGALNG